MSDLYFYLFFFYKNHDTKNDIYEDLVEVEVVEKTFDGALEKARALLGSEKRDRFVLRKIIVRDDKK